MGTLPFIWLSSDSIVHIVCYDCTAESVDILKSLSFFSLNYRERIGGNGEINRSTEGER